MLINSRAREDLFGLVFVQSMADPVFGIAVHLVVTLVLESRISQHHFSCYFVSNNAVNYPVRKRVLVLRHFNSKGYQRQDAIDKSLGVGSLTSCPGPTSSKNWYTRNVQVAQNVFEQVKFGCRLTFNEQNERKKIDIKASICKDNICSPVLIVTFSAKHVL